MSDNVSWKTGDRFTYVMMKGGFAYGTVVGISGDRVIAKLDCQKDGETYIFHRSNSHFMKGEF